MAFVKCWKCHGAGLVNGKLCPQCGGSGGYITGSKELDPSMLEIKSPKVKSLKVNAKATNSQRT